MDGYARKAKAISVDAEGKVISSFDGENLTDDGLAYNGANSAEPIPPLPKKTWNSDGELEVTDGQTMPPLQAEGGGFQNSNEDRYVPIYRY